MSKFAWVRYLLPFNWFRRRKRERFYRIVDDAVANPSTSIPLSKKDCDAVKSFCEDYVAMVKRKKDKANES